ncbi:MAG: 4'-phosphopantetheinyl transferase family protein [Oscillospiraceae bacterium]
MLRVFVGEGDARELLARAVRQTWGLDALPEIARLPGGKPVFPNYPDLHFNLSHSGTLALCALSDRPVGADLEVIRPRSAKLPAYVYKGAEYDRFLALGGDWNAFYTLWTEKESILKYTGEGLKALRRAALPAGCVLTGLSGSGWKGAVCGHERTEFFQEDLRESL